MINCKATFLSVVLWEVFALITARKRSLGQGYIFRSVCQEFCPQGGCLVRGGSCCQGGCLVRGVPAPGGLLQGVPAVGGACSGGCLVETPQTATAAGGTHSTGMHSCFRVRERELSLCRTQELTSTLTYCLMCFLKVPTDRYIPLSLAVLLLPLTSTNWEFCNKTVEMIDQSIKTLENNHLLVSN